MRTTIVFAVSAFAMACGTSVASDQEDLISKGAARLTDDEIAQMYIGNKINRRAGNTRFTAHYKKDGTKVTTVGGKTIRRTWSYKNGQWCETLNRGNKRVCNIIIYKLGGKCHGLTTNGQTKVTWTC